MKGDNAAKIHYSKCSSENRSFDLGSKEAYELTDSIDSSPDNGPPTMVDSSVKYANRAADSLSGKLNKCKEERVGEQECLTTVEGSRSSHIDWDLPELEVCYKEMDHHAVKDIYIDEGERTSIGHEKYGSKPRLILSKRLEDKTDSGVELELFISGELEPSLLDDSWYTSEVNDTAEPCYQVCDGKSISARSSVGSNAAGSLHLDVQASCALDRIMFDFKGPSVEAEDLHNHKGSISDNLSDDRKVECTNFSTRGKGTDNENVQLPDNKGQRHTDGDAQDVEPNVSTHDWRNVADPLQYDEGEITFRTESFITYSGPIPFSGCLSESSAASRKSFTFPVLRSSNSSPVGMARGERRRLMKHKDWKWQFFCCRF